MNPQSMLNLLGTTLLIGLVIGTFVGGLFIKQFAKRMGKVENATYLKSCLIVFLATLASLAVGYVLGNFMTVGNKWTITFMYLVSSYIFLMCACKLLYPCSWNQAIKTLMIPTILGIIGYAVAVNYFKSHGM